MFNDSLQQTSERDDTLLAGTADLQVASLVSLLAIALLVGPLQPPRFLRAVLAIPLFCFLPGYALLAALFPARASRETPDRVRPTGAPPLVDRLALAVAVSLGIVPLVGVALSPLYGISVPATLVALGVVTVGAAIVAMVRRTHVAMDRRFAPLASVSRASFRPQSSTSRFLVAAAVLGVAIAGVSAAYAATTDDPASTEFYLVNDSDGGVALNGGTGADDTRWVAVEHNADGPATYTVVIREHSEATGMSELARERISVSGPERVLLTVSDVPADADRVEYLLYAGTPPDDTDPEDAIRRLWVTLDDDS